MKAEIGFYPGQIITMEDLKKVPDGIVVVTRDAYGQGAGAMEVVDWYEQPNPFQPPTTKSNNGRRREHIALGLIMLGITVGVVTVGSVIWMMFVIAL